MKKILIIIYFIFFLIWPSQIIANDTKVFYSGFSFSNTYESNATLAGYSSKLIKSREADGFYDDFIIPAIKNAYKYLPKGKYMCLNVPDLMYAKIKKKWKACDKKEKYYITVRIGSNVSKSSRNDSEYIYCWIKK